MAKHAKHVKTIKTHPTWTPSIYDAMNLAALRYFALELEQVAISVYARDNDKRDNFEKLQKEIAKFVRHIREDYGAPHARRKMKGGGRVIIRSGECYDSWVVCSGHCMHPDLC